MYAVCGKRSVAVYYCVHCFLRFLKCLCLREECFRWMEIAWVRLAWQSHSPTGRWAVWFPRGECKGAGGHAAAAEFGEVAGARAHRAMLTTRHFLGICYCLSSPQINLHKSKYFRFFFAAERTSSHTTLFNVVATSHMWL